MLTGKQKHFLRSRAMTLKPAVNVGKNGLTPKFAQTVADVINNRELIKVSLLPTTESTTKEVGAYLEQTVPGLEVAQTIGRMVVVYRVSDKENHRHLSAKVNELGR